MRGSIRRGIALSSERSVLSILGCSVTSVFTVLKVSAANKRFYCPRGGLVRPRGGVSVLARLHAGFGLPMNSSCLCRRFKVRGPTGCSRLGGHRRRGTTRVRTTGTQGARGTRRSRPSPRRRPRLRGRNGKAPGRGGGTLGGTCG